MVDVGGVLRQVGELSLLSWSPGFIHLFESKDEWFVIYPQLELSALELIPEVSDSGEGGKELPVECAVNKLRFV